MWLSTVPSKLEILSITHLPPPTCKDGLTAIQIGNPSASKHLNLMFHDESIIHANKGKSVIWAEEGRVLIQGRGLMVSKFFTEYNGLLELSTEDYRRVAESDPSIRLCAQEIQFLKHTLQNLLYVHTWE